MASRASGTYEAPDACLAGRPFRLSGQSRHRAQDRHPSGGLHGRGGARAARRDCRGGHTKNLFLRDKKGTAFLVVALEDAAIELKSLHRLLGASGRFSFGSAELMRELLGVEPGSVTPFAAINDTAGRVTVVLDAAMMAHEVLNFHPAGEHRDDDDFARRAAQIPRSDRAQAADRGGFGPAGRPETAIAFRRASYHLIRRIASIEGDQGRLRPVRPKGKAQQGDVAGSSDHGRGRDVSSRTRRPRPSSRT